MRLQMKLKTLFATTLVCAAFAWSSCANAQNAPVLAIVQNGKTTASVVVAADAGPMEKKAAEDLVKYIEMMSGARPALVSTIPKGPAIVVGKAALAADASLQKSLDSVVKKNPTVRADAIVMRRTGNRVYLAGVNDESNYFAASKLLQNWGVRWYMPTDIGEVVPETKTLSVDKLDLAYAPPFEIRNYWLSWTGDGTGAVDFQRRNFMNSASIAGGGHALAKYTADLVPAGKSIFNISFSDPKTAQHIAAKIEDQYAKGENISIAIEDGNYENDSPSDKALSVEYDKYMMKPSLTDAMITLYNNVGKILREKHPTSKGMIGGLAYVNVTMPPKVVKKIEPNVVIWLAPIDIDPNHGMDDPKSPPRREYKEMMYEWSKLLNGRLAIYDYDQGQLVWRDIPNPSQHAFVQDVKHYAKAGILGISTESRGAIGTTFLNLYFRGQLMWNPNANVAAMQNEFYPKFYGPASAPMAKYWDTIFNAWKNTVSTEHEYFIAPAIYTPQVVSILRTNLVEATRLVAPLKKKAKLTRNERQYLDRIAFTQNSFDIIDNYMGAVFASANDADYKTAADFADKGLAARAALGKMNPTFTSVVNEGGSAAWWNGEPAFMRELLSYTDGTKGTLIAKTPKQWAWKSEAPLLAGWTYQGMEGAEPKNPNVALATQDATVANNWNMLDTGVYLQGQGVLAPDGQSYTGHYWYQTTVDLTADQIAGKTHMMFPGLFNEAWLYVNGERVAHRPYTEPWWLTDYKFVFDSDVSGKLKVGKNIIAIRGFNPHHFGGIFRRPFLYRAVG